MGLLALFHMPIWQGEKPGAVACLAYTFFGEDSVENLCLSYQGRESQGPLLQAQQKVFS
jgi:hypothetical protein